MTIKYDPEKHHRQSIRQKGYDYGTVGTYFVTICTWERECILGEVKGDEVILTQAGQAAQDQWKDLAVGYPVIDLDVFVVMPNHFHGLLTITEREATSLTLSQIMRAYKSLSGIAINRVLGRSERPAWQRNYYERIVRNERELNAIREYILWNPRLWSEDEDNPVNQ